MSLDSIQDFIQQFGLYMQVMAVLAYIMNFRRIDTFVYLWVGILLITPSQYVYELYLLELAIQPENQALVRNIWYIGFAISDMVLVAIVALIARAQKLKFDFASNILAFSFISMAWVQLVRYVDHIMIETDVLGQFYSASIPTIHIMVTIVIVVFTLVMIAADGSRSRF